MSRVPGRARSRSWRRASSASSSACDRCSSCSEGTCFHVGAIPGQGQTVKLLNNLLSATAFAITSEALAFGVAAGLDPGTLLEVFDAGTGRQRRRRAQVPGAGAHAALRVRVPARADGEERPGTVPRRGPGAPGRRCRSAVSCSSSGHWRAARRRATPTTRRWCACTRAGPVSRSRAERLPMAPSEALAVRYGTLRASKAGLF